MTITVNTPKRRDKLVIMAEILAIAKKGSSKTHIMFKASLSFSQLNEYIWLLEETGLLEKTANGGKGIYLSHRERYRIHGEAVPTHKVGQ